MQSRPKTDSVQGSSTMIALVIMGLVGAAGYISHTLVTSRLAEANIFHTKVVSQSLAKAYTRRSLEFGTWAKTVSSNTTLKSHTLTGSAVSASFSPLAVIGADNQIIIPTTGRYLNQSLTTVPDITTAAWMIQANWRGTANKQVDFVLDVFPVTKGIKGPRSGNYQRPAVTCQLIGKKMNSGSAHYAYTTNTCPADYRIAGGYYALSPLNSRSSDYGTVLNNNSLFCAAANNNKINFKFGVQNEGILPKPYHYCYVRCCWNGAEI